jgi:GntR family transcriptional regulator/MocR family aminotransferase
MPMVRGIYRYPIKGLTPQPLRGVVLEEGKPFPLDRVFALARPGVPIDVADPRWAKKGLFLMLMLDEALARVHTHLDVDTMELAIWPGPPERDAGQAAPLLRADLGTAAGRRAVEEFFSEQVPGLRAAPTLVRSRTGHFMDKPDSVVSCINLATIRSLEATWGIPIDPLRFRANFYIDGAAPWSEFDWVGSDMMLGDVLFRVDRRNGRCGATNVNPATGERDLDLPGALRKSFGHKDLGVYLIARSGGKVEVGDPVTLPVSTPSAPAVPTWTRPPDDPATFICRGCYFIYDERKGAPTSSAGTPFAHLPDDWRCPDCGTVKTNFVPTSPRPEDPAGAD